MMETKPNRAERRALKSKKPENYVKVRQAKKNDSQRQIRPLTTTPQIAAPSRATRFAGLT